MPPRVFAFGSNSAGQLGIGHNEDTSTPQECQFDSYPWMPGEKIEAFAAGGNHTLLLTSSGRVFAAGSNEKGQCGFGAGQSGCNTFKQVANIGGRGINTELGQVTHVAASWEASLLVVTGNRVYSCGTGSKGELGLGVGKALARTPELIIDLSTISQGTKVARLHAAMSHVILLTTGGDVFGWGASRKGQLGQESVASRSVWEPADIRLDQDIRSIAVGRDFTYLLNTNGAGHLIGDQKLLGDCPASAESPQQEVFAGWTHLFFRIEGKLIGVGRNNHNQLPPEDLPSLKLVAVGSEHCIALTQDDKVVTWGWGEHGNCGPQSDCADGRSGRANEITLFQKCDQTVSFLAAGCATSFVVVSASE